jgi:cell division protein FtsB
MILEITEKDMLVDVNRDQIVISRDEYHDLKNQIKILKAKIKDLKADSWARENTRHLLQDDFK